LAGMSDYPLIVIVTVSYHSVSYRSVSLVRLGSARFSSYGIAALGDKGKCMEAAREGLHGK
jgi:hypothetical protein